MSCGKKSDARLSSDFKAKQSSLYYYIISYKLPEKAIHETDHRSPRTHPRESRAYEPTGSERAVWRLGTASGLAAKRANTSAAHAMNAKAVAQTPVQFHHCHATAPTYDPTAPPENVTNMYVVLSRLRAESSSAKMRD